MPKLTALAVVLFCAALAAAENPQAAIEKVIAGQQAAWNRRDLENFMAGYWNSPQVTFSSGSQTLHGWQTTLDHYRKSYQSGGAEMGTLTFSDLKIEMLGKDAAFVRGAFHLKMSDGKTPHGVFTLIFRKFPEGWRIVHDHSSGE